MIFKPENDTELVVEWKKVETETRVYEANTEIKNGKSVLEFWQRSETFYPRLSKNSKLVLSFSACSTESERIFSASRLIKNQRRRSLSDNNTEQLIKTSPYLRRIKCPK